MLRGPLHNRGAEDLCEACSNKDSPECTVNDPDAWARHVSPGSWLVFWVGQLAWMFGLSAYYFSEVPSGTPAPPLLFIAYVALLFLPMLVWRIGQQFLSSRKIKVLPRWFDSFAAALGTVLLYAFGAAAFFRVIPGRDHFQFAPYLFVVGLLVGVGVVLVSKRLR